MNKSRREIVYHKTKFWWRRNMQIVLVAILVTVLTVVAVTGVVLAILAGGKINREVQRTNRLSQSNADVLHNIQVTNERLRAVRNDQIIALRRGLRAAKDTNIRACRRSNRSDQILRGLVQQALALIENPNYPGITESQRVALVHSYKKAFDDLRARKCGRKSSKTASFFPLIPAPLRTSSATTPAGSKSRLERSGRRHRLQGERPQAPPRFAPERHRRRPSREPLPPSPVPPPSPPNSQSSFLMVVIKVVCDISPIIC